MPFKKIRPEEAASTESLIAAIERKDRRFRLFQTVFMVGTFVALTIIISAQQRTLDGVNQQLSQAKAAAQQQTKQTNNSDVKIERRLDCMVVFFSQKDRTNLSIANIDKCTLNRDGNLQQFFSDSKGETTTTPTQQNGDAGTTSLTPSAAPKTGDSAPTPAPTKPTVPTAPTPTADPIKILGIPVCVPLTSVCIR